MGVISIGYEEQEARDDQDRVLTSHIAQLLFNLAVG